MSTTQPLVDRWRPTSLSEIQGNNKSIKELKAWADGWTAGDKPQLLVGDAGTGKTSTAEALANDMGWSLIEFNASDDRKSADMESIAGSIQSTSVDGSRCLVLLDEMDSLGTRTNVDPLTTALKDPQNPVVVVANEEWKVPNAIERLCKTREFSLGKRSIKAKLKEIAEAEGFDVSPQDLGKLATRGNLRAAIHDLQRFESESVDWDDRTDETDSFTAMDKYVKGERAYNVELNPEELVVWLDENLSADFDGLEAGMAYDALARADIQLGRARDTGEYRFWKYAANLAESTADLRLTEPYGGYIKKSYPEWFRHSTPKPTDKSGEATLYRALSDYEGGSFQFGGGYDYFRRVFLPHIKSLPDAVRYRVALEAGIGDDGKALKALDLTSRKYEDWLAEEGGETFDEAQQQSIDDW